MLWEKMVRVNMVENIQMFYKAYRLQSSLGCWSPFSVCKGEMAGCQS